MDERARCSTPNFFWIDEQVGYLDVDDMMEARLPATVQGMIECK